MSNATPPETKAKLIVIKDAPAAPLPAVEQMYRIERIAELLTISEREVARQIALYEETKGKEGIGPRYKLNIRCTVVPASAVLHWLRTHAL